MHPTSCTCEELFVLSVPVLQRSENTGTQKIKRKSNLIRWGSGFEHSMSIMTRDTFRQKGEVTTYKKVVCINI